MQFSKNTIQYVKRTLLILAVPTLVFSAENKTAIQLGLIRNKHFKPKIENVELRDLITDNAFDGEHFKIVLKTSNEAISLTDPDAALRLKAATAYYQLTRARDFWINDIKSENVKNLPKITVRLEHTRLYSELAHYQSETFDPEYNNALSINPGRDDIAKERDLKAGIVKPDSDYSWGPEIWFRPVKKIETSDIPGASVQNPLTSYLHQLNGPITNVTISRFVQTTLQHLFYPGTLQTSYQTSLINQAVAVGTMAILIQGSSYANKFFVEKYYFMDTAMIPEVIYHEFAHVALSDSLYISHSTAVNEGMADYFAASVSNHPKIGAGISKYSLSLPKNGKNKEKYSARAETKSEANGDFVLALLWSVKKLFPERANQIIFDAKKGLSTSSSTIYGGLLRALLDSCDLNCADPKVDKTKLRELFSKRGF